MLVFKLTMQQDWARGQMDYGPQNTMPASTALG